MAPPAQLQHAKGRVTYALRNKKPTEADLIPTKDTDPDLYDGGRRAIDEARQPNPGLTAINTSSRPDPEAEAASDQGPKGIKRKITSNRTSTKRRKMLSLPNESLAARYPPIQDSEESEESQDEGREDCFVPIGTVKTDPSPRRLVLATINENGDVMVTPVARARNLRRITLTKDHEKILKTDEMVALTDESLMNIFRVKSRMTDSSMDCVKSYVFKMMREPNGGRWIDVDPIAEPI